MLATTSPNVEGQRNFGLGRESHDERLIHSGSAAGETILRRVSGGGNMYSDAGDRPKIETTCRRGILEEIASIVQGQHLRSTYASNQIQLAKEMLAFDRQL